MCECGKAVAYASECRDCYENRLRRESRDAYDQDTHVRTKMMLHKERCRVRLHKNYEGPPSGFRGDQ